MGFFKRLKRIAADTDSVSRTMTGRKFSDHVQRVYELFIGNKTKQVLTESAYGEQDSADCKLLGISPGASERVVRWAYKAYQTDHHPDKFQSPLDKELQDRLFKDGQAAFERICLKREWKLK